MNRRNLLAFVLMAFLPVLGIGAVTSYLRDFHDGIDAADTASFAPSRPGPDDEIVAQLSDYTRSIGTKAPAPTAVAAELLPDVNTMIERLVARLEMVPGDVKGWRMLGWSYFNTGRYEQAATAYAKAVELDPNSADLKQSYEQAKSKVAVGHAEEGPAATATSPPTESSAEIRAMVDGLARRLESAPRDVEGWTRLMRSRIVLGERDVAVEAFRKALDIFKDDSAASGRISAAASELGLKTD